MVIRNSLTARDYALLFLLLVPFCLLVFYLNSLIDDAFISFRYARNLIEGHGLRYNLSENPPIEGYSNFLWVLILAFFMKLRVEPGITSRVISILSALGLYVAMYAACRRLFGLDRFRSFIGTLSLVLFPTFAVWATGGLETMLFNLCFFLLIITFYGIGDAFPTRRAGILGLLLVYLRPDGIGYAMMIPIFFGVYFLYTKKEGNWLRWLITYAVIVCSGFLLLTLFRLIYFHALMPNTVFAKVGFTGTQLKRGIFYVAHFFLAFVGVGIILVSAIRSLFTPARNHPLVLLVVFALVLVFVPVVLGGDFMAMARFMLPLVPILCLLLALTLCPPPQRLRTAGGFVLLLLTSAVIGLNILPAFNLHVTPESMRSPLHFRWNQPRYMTEKHYWERMKTGVEQWGIIGKKLGEISRPEQSIVTGPIGAIGYYSRMTVYDRFGLVSREIAQSDMDRDLMSAGHDKYVDVFYFYKYRPDYLEPRIVPLEDLENWKKKMFRSYLMRSKSHERRDIIQRFNQFKADYTVFTMPVDYQWEGKPMVLLTYRLKELDDTSPPPEE